jgi:hypothetical protein
MGTKSQEVLCDEHGIGGDGGYCGSSYAKVRTTRGFLRPRARRDLLCERVARFFCPGILVNHTRGRKHPKGHYRRANTSSSDPHYIRVEHLLHHGAQVVATAPRRCRSRRRSTLLLCTSCVELRRLRTACVKIPRRGHPAALALPWAGEWRRAWAMLV